MLLVTLRGLNMLKQSIRIVCSILLLIVCVLKPTVIIAAIDSDKSAKLAVATYRAPGSYCGVSCLYVLMRLANKEIDYKRLLTREYIGSHKGSSSAELKKAAEDYGLYAVPVGKLTSHLLRSCSYPVILHVKPDTTSREYDHYELFLGTNSGQARLFDPPEPVRLVPFQELVPRWDGNGLIVSATPIDLAAIFELSRKRFIVYVVIALVIILIVHWAKRWLPETLLNSRRKLFGLSIGQGIVFAIATLLCGMIYHFANDEGLLANANATALIQQAHLGNFIPKVSEEKIHKLLDSDTVFIDARFARDFKAGHLKGAISVPVNADDDERQKTTVNIAKDARIVVYCQSAGCKFAEKVAIRLIDDGFYNISIFRGGWNEWVAKNGKPKGVSL